MIKKALIFLVAILAPLTTVFPQTPPYYHYTSYDGLPSSTVYDMTQDNDGFIWFATYNGVSRFDGKNFVNFTTEDGLNSNNITCVTTSDSGEIYFGNYEMGVNILRNGKIENFRSKVKGRNFKTQFLLNYRGKIYAYGRAEPICILDKNPDKDIVGYFTTPFVNQPKSIDYLAGLTILKNNKLAALTSFGFFNVKTDTLTKINILGLPATLILCTAVRSDGSRFFGSKGCIYEVKNNKVIKTFRSDQYSDKDFLRMFCDSNDNIWFSVIGKGFYIIPAGSDSVIEMGSKMDLENTQVDRFFEDNENNIWICTYGKGVYCLNNLFFRNYTERDGITNNNITCLEKDKSGKLLIGTINGVSTLEKGFVDKLKGKSGIVISGYINGIKNSKGFIYISSPDLSPDYQSLFYKGLGYKITKFQCFSKMNDGSFLLGGTGNGIARYKDYKVHKSENYIYFPIFGDSTITNRVNALYIDKLNNIWVGTSLGLCKINYPPGSKGYEGWGKTFFPHDPVLNSKIRFITTDSINNVWFAGEKGIAKYNLDSRKITSYTEINSYSLTSTNTMAIDNKNRLWVGTTNGLFLFENKTTKWLNSKNGLPSSEVLSLYYDSSKNLMYIGTSNGLSLLNINAFDKYNPPSLKIRINSIKAGDSTYTDFSNLVFSPEQDNVYIDFIAINYSSPRSVKYMYVLNSDTTKTENSFIDFSSLKSGNYNLQIIAKDLNSNWGQPALIKFKILPHFTETTLFAVLIMGFILLIFLAVYIWRTKINSKKSVEKLELSERINDLKHQALSAMMNPHFTFNALNSVQFLINDNRKEEANNYIAMMAQLIRKNLDTAGSGFILLEEEIKRLTLYLDLEKLRFKDSFNYQFEIDKNVNPDITMIPNMIIQPFVENTLWHGIINSGKKGLIQIAFSFEQIEIEREFCKSLIIKITDNGIGINEARKNRKNDHISKGIQIIEERLRLLSTKMELPKPIMFEDLSDRDSASTGTEVIISLPPPLYKMISKKEKAATTDTD